MVVLVGYGDDDYGSVESGADIDGDGAGAGDGGVIVACIIDGWNSGYGVEDGAGL